MGKWADSATLYVNDTPVDIAGVNAEGNIIASAAKEEKLIPEKDKMGFVQSLQILHLLRDGIGEGNDIYNAFQTVFQWIDEMFLLLYEIGNPSCTSAGCKKNAIG